MAVGIVGSILISALLYVLMSLCICTMQASPQIDLEAPFAAAFTSLIQPDTGRVERVFLAMSARFVSFGALTGELVSSHGALSCNRCCNADWSRHSAQARQLTRLTASTKQLHTRCMSHPTPKAACSPLCQHSRPGYGPAVLTLECPQLQPSISCGNGCMDRTGSIVAEALRGAPAVLQASLRPYL